MIFVSRLCSPFQIGGTVSLSEEQLRSSLAEITGGVPPVFFSNGGALGDLTSALCGSTSHGSNPLANSLGPKPPSLSAGTGSFGKESTMGQR